MAITRVSSPSLLFNFFRSDCITGIFPDSTVSNLIGNLCRPSSCLLSNGIKSSVSSSSNISQLISSLAQNSFTLEFWLQFNSTNLGEQPILVVGTPNSYNLEISRIWPSVQSPVSFNVRVSNSKSATSVLTVGNLTPSLVQGAMTSIHHVTISLSFSTIVSTTTNFPTFYGVTANCTIDGVYNSLWASSSDYTISSTYGPRLWYKSGVVRLLAGRQASSPYMSSDVIYLFAIYNTAITQAEIIQNFRAGLPNSLPVTLSSTVSIQQNGELGDHFYDPAFYQYPILSSSLALVSLSIYDLDDQLVNRIYNAAKGPLSYAVLVAPLPDPSKCRLYDFSGVQVTSVSTPVLFNKQAGGYVLRIRPADNQYSTPAWSVLCSISFRAVDGVTGSLSADIGVASIVVTHVNRPPIALNCAATAYANKIAIAQFAASDVDSAVMAIWITRLPTHGLIFPIYPNGTISKAPITAIPCFVPTNSPKVSICGVRLPSKGPKFTVGYQYSGNINQVAADAFSFSAQDTEGRRSMPALLNITVQTALQALTRNSSSFSAPVPLEGQMSKIWVYGADLSNLPQDLGVRIVRTPSYGTLYYLSDTGAYIAITAGQAIPQPIKANAYASGLGLFYQGRASYFNSPQVTWNGSSIPPRFVPLESFDFQVFEAGAGSSSVVTQTVTVRNVNQPTGITFTYDPILWPTKSITLFALSLATPTSKPSSAVISGFKLSDPDVGVGLIRVHVKSSAGGVFSLNTNYIDSIDLYSQKYCFGNARWQCMGSGFSDTEVIFVATPEMAELALNGIEYHSTKPNIVDIVNVSLADGAGGDCLDKSAQSSGSVRNGCLVTSAYFKVTVAGYATTGDENTSTGSSLFASLDYRFQLVIIGIIVVMSLAVLRCLCICCGCGRRNKGPPPKDESSAPTTININLSMNSGATDQITRQNSSVQPDDDETQMGEHSMDKTRSSGWLSSLVSAIPGQWTESETDVVASSKQQIETNHYTTPTRISTTDTAGRRRASVNITTQMTPSATRTTATNETLMYQPNFPPSYVTSDQMVASKDEYLMFLQWKMMHEEKNRIAQFLQMQQLPSQKIGATALPIGGESFFTLPFEGAARRGEQQALSTKSFFEPNAMSGVMMPSMHLQGIPPSTLNTVLEDHKEFYSTMGSITADTLPYPYNVQPTARWAPDVALTMPRASGSKSKKVESKKSRVEGHKSGYISSMVRTENAQVA